MRKPTILDFFLLSFFTILITAHPYFLHAEINLFEHGLYLPGIDAILRGQIPYRDFFHLRGPFELYFPAFVMRWLGPNVAVLAGYFYFGTILTLLLYNAVARSILKTRLFFYLFVPVFVARTFPRVFFTYWGGMRYALGTLALLLIIQYFKTERKGWLLSAGFFCCCALLTSVEIGVCVLAGFLGALFFCAFMKYFSGKQILLCLGAFSLGFCILAFPYLVYLMVNQAFYPFLESVHSIVTNMQNVYNLKFIDTFPGNLSEAVSTMVDPNQLSFKRMTPSYLYVFLLAYFVVQYFRRKLSKDDVMLFALGCYGFVMYNSAFRNIGGPQFEMALQPEKILLFCLLERTFLSAVEKRKELMSVPSRVGNNRFYKILSHKNNYLIYAFIVVMVCSSLFYCRARFSKRFFAYKFVMRSLSGKETKTLIPLDGQETKELALPRVKGMVVPLWQAQDLEQITKYVESHTVSEEPVFMFPELGALSFIVNRPFVGRFPMVTFSWFNPKWPTMFLEELQRIQPRLAIVSKDPGPSFEKVYFKVKSSKESYEKFQRYILDHYVVVGETNSYLIYELAKPQKKR